MIREEAIGRIQEHIRIHSKKEPFTPYLDEAFDMAIEALKEQRPHGEWKWKMTYQGSHFRYGNIYCSECEYEAYKDVPIIRLKGKLFNFCPNCGADMSERGVKRNNGLLDRLWK